MWVLSPGQRVDRYLVEAMIGAGGVAVVYRVRDTTQGTLHALKLLVTDTPSVRKRMRREGRVQFALRHPNIVRVTDLLEVEGRTALIMEYVDGPTLREWMLREDRPLAELLAVFRVVARAVAFAHAHGHVHRDLKPANVLLGRAEGGLVPKVADFGIVKSLHGASVGQTTQQGVFIGTAEYTAPEQIRSAGQVDHRADLFALGCILYEMACGQVPFAGKDLVATLNAVRRGTYVEPLRLVPDLPPAVVQTIEGLLKAEPERRIASCEELLVLLADAPGLPVPDGSFDVVPIALDPTWAVSVAGPVVTLRPPPDVHGVSPTEVPSAPLGESRHPFDDAAYSGVRALVHRLALELLALQRGTRDPAVLGARYASAVSGVQGIRRSAEAVGIAQVDALARGLVELIEAGRRDGRPLDAVVVDAVLRGMDALLLRLKSQADGRQPGRGAQREFERAADVVEELACSRREVDEGRQTP